MMVSASRWTTKTYVLDLRRSRRSADLSLKFQTADVLWAVVFAKASASVTLTSGSNTQTFSIQAGITKLQLASAPGTISGTLSRNGATVISVAPSGAQFTYVTSPATYNYNAFSAEGSA